MDPRESEVDYLLGKVNAAASRATKPAALAFLSLVPASLFLGIVVSAFTWLTGSGWQSEETALRSRLWIAVGLRLAGAVAILLLTAFVTWVAADAAIRTARLIAYKLVAEPEQALAILRYLTHEIHRPVRAYRGVMWLLLGGALLFLLANRLNVDPLRFFGSALSVAVLLIVSVSHYHALRKARLWPGGFQAALDLEFGAVSRLSDGLQVAFLAVLLLLGVPRLLVPFARLVALRLDHIPRSVISSFVPKDEQVLRIRDARLRDYDRMANEPMFDSDQGLRVTAERLNVRSSATRESAVLFTVSRGERGSVAGYNGEWVSARFGQGEGFVHSRYVAIDQAKGMTLAAFVERAMRVAVGAVLAAAFALVVAPMVIRATGSFIWALVVSTVGTMASGGAVWLVEQRYGPQDPTSWTIVLLTSLVATLVAPLLNASNRRAGWG